MNKKRKQQNESGKKNHQRQVQFYALEEKSPAQRVYNTTDCVQRPDYGSPPSCQGEEQRGVFMFV